MNSSLAAVVDHIAGDQHQRFVVIVSPVAFDQPHELLRLPPLVDVGLFLADVEVADVEDFHSASRPSF